MSRAPRERIDAPPRADLPALLAELAAEQALQPARPKRQQLLAARIDRLCDGRLHLAACVRTSHDGHKSPPLHIMRDGHSVCGLLEVSRDAGGIWTRAHPLAARLCLSCLRRFSV